MGWRVDNELLHCVCVIPGARGKASGLFWKIQLRGRLGCPRGEGDRGLGLGAGRGWESFISFLKK